jgi:hypothetical protein
MFFNLKNNFYTYNTAKQIALKKKSQQSEVMSWGLKSQLIEYRRILGS